MIALQSRSNATSLIDQSLPLVFGLEGLPYSGKTFLSRYLVNSGMSRLGELAEFFKNGENFPRFSETTADARESFDWFVRAEVDRFSRLDYYPSDSLIISDRTIVSSLAYSYARRKAFHFGDQRDEHENVKRAVDLGQLYIPPLIYVRIPIETYFKRRSQTYDFRCETLGKQAVENVSLADRERKFFEAQIDYYDTIAHRLGEQVCVLDGERAPQENNWIAKNWCQEVADIYQPINLEEILL